MKYVIDTNVLITANGQSSHSSAELALRCARFLSEQMEASDLVCDDSLDLILTEYKRHMAFSGQPGVGDFYFRWYVSNRWNDKRIRRVNLDPEREVSSYIPDPLQKFDPSDHKWIAVYLVEEADFIVNATDSDWREAQSVLESEKIYVHELNAAEAVPDTSSTL